MHTSNTNTHTTLFT